MKEKISPQKKQDSPKQSSLFFIKHQSLQEKASHKREYLLKVKKYKKTKVEIRFQQHLGYHMKIAKQVFNLEIQILFTNKVNQKNLSLFKMNELSA